MVQRIQNLIKQELQYQILLKEAELKTLQMQINPHFLFNTHFILNSLIQQEDYAAAERLTSLLGNFLEYIAHDSISDVSLASEVSHARTYADIQMIRFSKRVTLEFADLPQPIAEIKVPKLMLQPLVENAFEHAAKDSHYSVIRVDFQINDRNLMITVEDNGNNIDEAEVRRINRIIHGDRNESDGIALSNVHQRLQILYGGGSGLVAEQSELGGIKMIIKIEGADIR
jgi:two-component system, sensor histidine kinase YesM